MDHMAVKRPFGDGIQTHGNSGHAVEKGRITLRRSRFRLLLVVAIIITGTVETPGFIMIPDLALSWAIEQLHALQNSLHLEDGVGVKQVCNTSDCVLAANHMLLRVNQSANPCDDFYEFACGNWAKFSWDQGFSNNDHFTQIRTSEAALVRRILLRQPDSMTFEPAKAAAIVYSHCINGSEVDTRDNIKTIIGLTAKLGGWPSLEGPDWNENAFDLTTTIAFIFREYFSDIFVRLNLAHHGVNETIYVIELSVPFLVSVDKLGSDSFRTAFKSYYANTVCELIGHRSGSRNCDFLSSSWSSLTQDADKLMELEKALGLAAATVPQQPSNNTNNQEIFTVEEFQKYLDKYLERSENSDRRATISWKGLLNKLFGTLGVEINDNQVLIVNNPCYFIRLAKILAATPNRNTANYVVHMLAFSELVKASGKIYQWSTNFYSRIGLPFQSREDYCLSTTMTCFAIPVMHEYLKTKSSLEDRAVLEKMAGNLRTIFDKRLESNTWLTDATKLAVRKKLGALKFFIGYPNWLLNATEIEGRFEGLAMASNSIEMLANAMTTEMTKSWQILGTSPRAFGEPQVE